jgi:hypothetical protein
MLSLVRRGLAEASRHIGHPFTNFIAFHNRFPFFTLFATIYSQINQSLNEFF